MQRCRRSDYASADQFQFMHPAMDATLKTKNYFTYIGISIHALRVECNRLPQRETGADRISIHALRVECNLEP